MDRTCDILCSVLTIIGGIAFWISVTFVVLKTGIERARQHVVDKAFAILGHSILKACDQLTPVYWPHVIPRLQRLVCEGEVTIDELLTAPNEVIRLAGKAIAQRKFCLCCLIKRLIRII